MDKIKLEARREAKRLEAIEKRIAQEKNQKHVSYIDISIEWKKSRTWGNNPYLNAIIHYKDNTRESYDKKEYILQWLGDNLPECPEYL